MSRWPRIIVHADMDAFFASIEQLDHPELRGRPVLVAHDGPRSVVTTASYEARPFGVGSAMALAIARRKCPRAVVVPPRFERYREVSRKVMEALAAFATEIEPLSLDEAFLDASEFRGRYRTPKELARSIKAAVYEATGGLKVSVGISATKFVAKVASDHRKPDGLTVVPADRAAAFLDPLPLRKLWGVGPKGSAKLESLGLRTIGDVARASPGLLRSALGSMGEPLRLLAQGVDPRPVRRREGRKSLSAEETLDVDVVGAGAIRPHLVRSARLVAERLQRARLLASGVRVKLKTADFRVLSRQSSLRRPTDDREVLAGAATELLGAFPLDAPIRLVGVGVHGLISREAPRQLELFGEEGVVEILEERRRREGPVSEAG